MPLGRVLAATAAMVAAVAVVVAAVTLVDAATVSEGGDRAQALGAWLAEPGYKCGLVIGIAGLLDWLAGRAATPRR